MKKDKTTGGIRLRLMNYILGGLTFGIAVLMLVTTFLAITGYNSRRRTSEAFFECREGAQEIQNIMEKFRNSAPKQFGDLKVLCLRDMQKDTVTDFATGAVTKTGLPASNVLYFELENDSWCCLRPSGTEPKLKFYMGVRGENMEDTKEKLQILKDAVIGMI